MNRYASVVLLCLAVGCAQPTAVAPEADSDESLRSEHAPTPYSASQIREAHPDGTTLKFLIHQAGVEDVLQLMHFSGGDEAGTTVASSQQKPDGTPVGSSSSVRVSWSDLRDHARFDTAKTSIGKSKCIGPAGHFDCMLYQVDRDDGAVQEFHFAKSKPGPPVLMEIRKDNRELMRMELLEYQRGSR